MKRFIESVIFRDAWFRHLSSKHKILWIYLFTQCSKIGIWEEGKEAAEFDMNTKINWDEAKKDLSDKVYYMENLWIIKNFISYQYPKLLVLPKSPLHIAVFNELNEKGLFLIVNSLSIDYAKTMDSLQVKKSKGNGIGNGIGIGKEKEEEVENHDSNTSPSPSQLALVDTWKQPTEEGFQEYIRITEPEFDRLMENWEWIAEQKEYYPGVSIRKSVEKAWGNFWGTKAGWENRRKKKAQGDNWPVTVARTIKMNLVYWGKNEEDIEQKYINSLIGQGKL